MLFWNKITNTTVNNSSSEVTLLDTGLGSKTLPADCLYVGKTIKIKMFGYFSNTLTPTLTIKLKFGSVIVCTTGAIITASGVTNGQITFEFLVTCQSVGATGTVWAQGQGLIGSTVVQIINTTASTLDTTASQTLDITSQWGTLSVSNTITCTNLTMEIL